MSMTIGTVFGFALVALVVLIKLALLVLALILIGRGLFGRRSPVTTPARHSRSPVSGD